MYPAEHTPGLRRHLCPVIVSNLGILLSLPGSQFFSKQMSRLIFIEHIGNLYANFSDGLYFNPHFIDEEAEAQKDSHLGKFSGDSLYGHF